MESIGDSRAVLCVIGGARPFNNCEHTYRRLQTFRCETMTCCCVQGNLLSERTNRHHWQLPVSPHRIYFVNNKKTR